MTNVRLFVTMIYGMVVHSQVSKQKTIDLIVEQISACLHDEPRAPQSTDVETVRRGFNEWWNKTVGTGQWTTLERLAAHDAWNAALDRLVGDLGGSR